MDRAPDTASHIPSTQDAAADLPAPEAPELDLLTCDEMLDLGMHVSEILEALEDDLGPDAVWTLTRAFGGSEVQVPSPERLAKSTLARRIGLPIARWLASRHCGRFIVPQGPQGTSARALAQARRLVTEGASTCQIATRLKCNERTARRYKAKLRQAGYL